MQKLLKQLNKKFDDQLVRQRPYQQTLDKMHSVLKEHGMQWLDKDEFACFQNEIMYHSLINKQLFEDTFRDVYASMFDYWNELDYQERKHHVNVDIARVMASMTQFVAGDDIICLPIFDERMNRIYTQEMVLFDLKQYRRFKTDFKDILVSLGHYGEKIYQSEFCSCRYITTYERGIAVYSDIVNRIYFIENDQCIDTLSLDIARLETVNEDILQSLVHTYENQDVLAMINILIEHQLVSDKMLKKLLKMQKKLSK